MIKAVIFDIGGVIVRTEDRTPRAQLEVQLGLAPGESDQLVFNSAMGQQAQWGTITTTELWVWLQQQLGLSAEGLRDFRTAFWGGDRIDRKLVNYIRTLRPHYQTAIISNATDDLLEQVARIDPDGDSFGLVVGSAYEKMMKPAPEIFLRTLARLGCQPDEAVFVDDFAHNVAGAQAVGMHAIHFTPGILINRELARLGVHGRG